MTGDTEDPAAWGKSFPVQYDSYERTVDMVRTKSGGSEALPGIVEGIRAFEASRGVADDDVSSQATRQEMRTYVCAQCHVEHDLEGAEKRLTFPWHEGLKADEILSDYDEVGFEDGPTPKRARRT